MAATSGREPEWFEAIAEWPARERRTARLAAWVFVVLSAVPLTLWLVASRAPNVAAAPWPTWDTDEFLQGKTAKKFETHFKETSWATYALRGVHDALVKQLGIAPAAGRLGEFDFETSSGEVLAFTDLANARERGFIVDVPWQTPRPRTMIAPNQTFWLRYRDNEVLRRDWLDSEGRVLVRINRFGLRERDDFPEAKPAGERRVVCIGDSMTFGWGVPEEMGWVRLLEDELRKAGTDIRTINCGAAGTVCADEYWYGLKNRFSGFGPDVVVMTLCLNDLVPSMGLSLLAPPKDLSLADVLAGKPKPSPLDLDPAADWVTELLKLPRDEGLAGGLYTVDSPFEAMWSQGVPQTCLREAKAFCDARGCGFVVVLWPFLQGLGPGRAYVFERLHTMVADECRAHSIPFVDLLPTLREVPAEDLWVTPADMHPNPKGHRLALPAIHRAVAAELR